MGATAQMVYRLLNFMSVDYDEQLATMNLLGIATDTGFFKYENTGPETFRVDVYKRQGERVHFKVSKGNAS